MRGKWSALPEAGVLLLGLAGGAEAARDPHLNVKGRSPLDSLISSKVPASDLSRCAALAVSQAIPTAEVESERLSDGTVPVRDRFHATAKSGPAAATAEISVDHKYMSAGSVTVSFAVSGQNMRNQFTASVTSFLDRETAERTSPSQYQVSQTAPAPIIAALKKENLMMLGALRSCLKGTSFNAH